jgi:hypothetical protein
MLSEHDERQEWVRLAMSCRQARVSRPGEDARGVRFAVRIFSSPLEDA